MQMFSFSKNGNIVKRELNKNPQPILIYLVTIT